MRYAFIPCCVSVNTRSERKPVRKAVWLRMRYLEYGGPKILIRKSYTWLYLLAGECNRYVWSWSLRINASVCVKDEQPKNEIKATVIWLCHLSERTLVENGISRYRNMACAYATHKQTTARAFASAIESRLCVCVSSELLEKARKRDGNEKGGEERY